MNKVVVEKWHNINYKKIVSRVLDDEFHLANRLKHIHKVFIKPNLVSDIEEYIKNGSNTDIRIIEAVLAYLSKFPHLTVYLGESETGTKTKGRRLDNSLQLMGVLRLKKKYKFTIVNLTHDKKIDIEIPEAQFLKKIPMSKTFMDCDLIINLPKIKTHKYSIVTCALKNIFGAVPNPMKVMYHQNIHQVLADLNILLGHKMFVITDGIVCMEGQGPIYGTSIRLNTILFADNPIVNDFVASKIMHISYKKIKHLLLANENAHINLNKISIKTYKPLHLISPRAFRMSNKNLFTKIEGSLMQHPLVVKILLSDFMRRNITSKISFITDKMRGGSYSWYLEDKQGTFSKIKKNITEMNKSLAGTDWFWKRSAGGLSLYYPLKKAIAQYAAGSVLDVGAGYMPYRKYVLKKTKKYSSMDFTNTNGKIDYVGDALELSKIVKNKKFDTILCTEVLEHLQNPFIAAQELYEVLNDKGILILSVPFIMPLHNVPHDYFRYSRYGLSVIFKDFEIIELRASGGLLSLLHYLFSITINPIIFFTGPLFKIFLACNWIIGEVCYRIDELIFAKIIPFKYILICQKRTT